MGSFNPAPSARNNWTGTLATDGSLPGGGLGIDYTIVVNPVNAGSGQKQRSPKITVRPSDDKKTQKAKKLQGTKN